MSVKLHELVGSMVMKSAGVDGDGLCIHAGLSSSTIFTF